MTPADKNALARLTGSGASARATTDDLQALLLQVVFALLMVFIIAYFMFVDTSRKKRAEEILDLNRQKLVLAIEKTAENHRIKYGLNALMTQDTDGRRHFDADACIRDGRLEIAPAARKAFAAGSRAAAADYRAPAVLADRWQAAVLTEAGLSADALSAEERRWLETEVARRIEEVRLDARGVQRALAARLQRVLLARPELFNSLSDPGALADLIKKKSLELITSESGGEMLP
jgi:hypothetical protein